MSNVFTADIGGTNSRFAIFREASAQHPELIESHWLKTSAAASFAELLETLAGTSSELRPEMCDIAVIAVAGPVAEHVYCRPPNIDWDIDLRSDRIKRILPKAVLINDFVAQAYGCKSPIASQAQQVLAGRAVPFGITAVIGAGTGLGQAALVPVNATDYEAVPSEGGHTSFPFETPEEFALNEFLLREVRENYVRTETILSGEGLSRLHRFLTGAALTPQQVSEGLTPDSKTLQWMARFYGRICRNFALQVVARGGVYIAGGVAAKNPELIKHSEFEAEFRASATMASLLKDIPVYLISNEENALWGAAQLGVQTLRAQV